MKITKIEKQKHKKNFYSVFLDGKYAFHLNKDVLSNLKWEVGQEIDGEELRRVNRLEQIKEARDYAFLLLSYRSRSCQELRERLLKKGYEKEIAQEVVEELKSLHYLDDLAFAREWVEMRLREKRGKILIRQELLKKGIDKEVIEDSIAEGFGKIASSEDELAWRAIEKMVSRFQKLEKSKAYRRIKDFLVRRGFSIEATQNTLDRFFQDYVGDAD
ncbi:RecX family transcriptional regulator [bacterium]|nr:RecX family transcriptional regulator [bacterium]